MDGSAVFCSILETQYNTVIAEIETALLIPYAALRSIKANVSMAENIIIGNVSTSLDQIATAIETILHLNEIQQGGNSLGFCQVAFQCQALINILSQDRAVYLPFLTSEQVDQALGNYTVFENLVCRLGLLQMINAFKTNILEQFISKLDALTEQLQFSLTALQTRYLAALNSSGVFTALQALQAFLQCDFATCAWASSSQNSLAEYQQTYYLTYDGTWSCDLSPLLTKYNTKAANLQTQINKLLALCTLPPNPNTIPRDQVALN